MKDNEADRKHRLEEILQREDGLDSDPDDTPDPIDQETAERQEMEEDLAAAQATAEGFCVECKDQEASYSCEQCAEEFCEVCYGNRRRTATLINLLRKDQSFIRTTTTH